MWKYLATQTFFLCMCMCMCVKRAESNYQQGVEHRSALIWTITVGFIYHRGKQATVGISAKALCMSPLSFNLFLMMQKGTQAFKISHCKKKRCDVKYISGAVKGAVFLFVLMLDVLSQSQHQSNESFKWRVINYVPSHSPNSKTNKIRRDNASWLSIYYLLGWGWRKSIIIHFSLLNYVLSFWFTDLWKLKRKHLHGSIKCYWELLHQ